jgi:pilus assembly protein CpaC
MNRNADVFLKLLLVLLLLHSFSVSRAEEAPATDVAETLVAPEPDTAPEKTKVPELSSAAKPQRRLQKARPDFMKSKLTMDRSESEADHRSLILSTGVDKIVDLDPGFKLSDQQQRIMVGNSTIVAVVPVTVGEDKQLIFKPVGEGETNVTVRDKTGAVRIIFEVIVAKQNQVRFLDRLRDRLKEVEGITIGLEDKNIVIRGEALTVADYGLIVNEIGDKSYGESVINKVVMSPITLGILSKKIEQDLQSFANTVKVNVINGKIILEGSVESEGVKTRCFNRAYWYLPPVKVKEPILGSANIETAEQDKHFFFLQNDISVVPPPPKRESKLVRLTVYFVELSKDFLKSFGFKWQPGFTADPSISIGSTTSGAAAVGNQGGFTFSGTIGSLFPAISAPPSSASYGRVLKTATVVAKSGENTSIKDQVSLPTQTIGQNGQVGAGPPVSVRFECAMTPTILQGQDIDINVNISQDSQIGKGIGGSPIVANHQVVTRLYLKSGEVAAVAAVNKQDVSTSFNRDLASSGAMQGAQGSTATTLFNLVRSKNMSKARGQFVFFVNPLIIDSASEGTEDLKKNFRMTSSNR